MCHNFTIVSTLSTIIESIPISIWLLLATFLVFKLLSSPKVKGYFGEMWVNRGLAKLDSEKYRVFHDIYLPHPKEEGTTQIDHLILSRYGIFVIETKNYKGWIFGSEKQRQWTQTIYKQKHKFQNPLHQNKLHIKAAATFLKTNPDLFHNIVYFAGDAKLKTTLPSNVMTRGLLTYISNYTEILLSLAKFDTLGEAIELHISSYNKPTVARAHKEHLQNRHRNR